MPWPAPKYIRSRRILTVLDAVDMILTGHWLFVRGRVQNPKIMRNWSLATIVGMTRFDCYAAEVNPCWKPAPKPEPIEMEVPF